METNKKLLTNDSITDESKRHCFRMTDDSMDDGLIHSYENRSIVFTHEVSKDYLKSRYGQWDAFVIVHNTEDIIIRQVTAYDAEKDVITLHSFNPNYHDSDVSLRDVTHIYYVYGKQTLKMA